MTDSLETLLDLLDLETVDSDLDLFQGRTPATEQQRIFGGQVAGQALVAASRTVPSGRVVHSLHAYFLRPGRPDCPIVYQVERNREGRSFSTRRVIAGQLGRPIFSMSASFQVAEPGLTHQVDHHGAPAPDSLPTLPERIAEDPGAWSNYYRGWGSFDIRPVHALRDPDNAADRASGRSQVWLRALGTLPDDPILHACALTYASDLTLLSVALTPHGLVSTDPRLQMASLDHAVWFHQPFRADEWLLYDQLSPAGSGGRGLASGRIYTREGRLVASVMQEGLIRFTPAEVDAAPYAQVEAR